MSGDLVRIAEASKLLGVSRATLDRWHGSGVFTADVVTPGGERRWSRSRILAMRGIEQGAEGSRRTICYARVSTSEQKADLQRQEELLSQFCAANGWSHEIISDTGSGMNYDKRGLRKLISLLMQNQVERLVLTHKDRLLRFGAEIIFAICAEQESEVTIINKTTGSETGDSFEMELAADVLEIVTVFSARMYGARSRKNRKLMAEIKAAAEKAPQ